MTAPLRISIDGYALGDSSAFRGIGTYVRGLLGGLGQLDDVAVTVLAAQRELVPDPHAWLRTRRIAPSRWAMFEHDFLLPFELRRAPSDVVHSPSQEPPRRPDRPWVQTLHGLLPLVGGADAEEQAKWARIIPRIQSASAWIAVSQQTADQAVELLDLPSDRVHVIPHGVGPEFTPDGPAAEGPYVLYVGEYGPDKGFVEAMDAIASLAERGFPHRLKMAGRIVPWTEGAIHDVRAASRRPDLVDLLGHVGHLTELPALYRGASALIVTSRFESFCLPALEALACGTPVVAFANSAIPETLDGCGVLVPDGDAEGVTEALIGLLSDAADRSALVSAGLVRAKTLTWKACAVRHLEVYRAAIESGG